MQKKSHIPKRKLPRVVPATDESDIWAATIFLMGLVRTIDVRRLGMLVVLDGMGERWRVDSAIRDWESPRATARHLIIGGQSRTEQTWFAKDIPYLRHRGLTRTEGVIINTDTPNTYKQSIWIADQIEQLAPTSVGVYVSPYHLIRAYFTLLKELLKRKCLVPLVPVPVDVSPFEVIPELFPQRVDAWDLVAGELVRFKKYQNEGHIPSITEIKDYYRWLEPWCAHVRST